MTGNLDLYLIRPILAASSTFLKITVQAFGSRTLKVDQNSDAQASGFRHNPDFELADFGHSL